MPDNAGKTERIWIVGASDGIGTALAHEWAAQGARLILSARSRDPLAQLAASLGPGHRVMPLDVGDRKQVDTACAHIAEDGPLDRIVHMAALYDPGKFTKLDPDRAAHIIAVNLTGSFHIAQTAPKLLREAGQLVLCGSVAGYIGLPQGQIYSATKAGVINLAESLRSEWAGQIDVRLISPGFVDTRLTRKNQFSMPALTSPKAAARAIIAGLNRRNFEVHFPRRFTYGLKLLRALPYWASLPLLRKLRT